MDSTNRSLKLIFGGIALLGMGLTFSGSYLAILSGTQGNYLQLGLNVLVTFIGGFILWVVAKPLINLLLPWRRKR